jgi:glycosyltransferase involved in cell wall biosynthesis
MSSKPKLSVHVITYNHARFIGQALDSILAQQVSFEYEIVVGDDCSTDGTAEIIRDYCDHWPGKIKAQFHDANVGMMRNVRETLERCEGEYIAFLEGDDYWTDPNKLQTQVEYLDQHPDCALCHHRVEHIGWPDGIRLQEFPPQRYRTSRPDPRALAMINYVQTCSVMFRQRLLPRFDEQFEQLRLGDWPLFVLLSQGGWIGYIDRTMAHYRVHANNTWNNRSADYKLKSMEMMAWYLFERVNADSKGLWMDTILALRFKEIALAMKALAIAKAFVRLKQFLICSVQFKKPFWLLNRLWPYYRVYNCGH